CSQKKLDLKYHPCAFLRDFLCNSALLSY
ncbi:hypothetical protein X975_19201, partial [Stegodyphus mimosarum]